MTIDRSKIETKALKDNKEKSGVDSWVKKNKGKSYVGGSVHL